MPAPALAHSGPARAWGGAYPVCVKDANFALKQPATQPYCTATTPSRCPSPPLDNHGKRVWTMNFDEQPAMSLTEAQLAGVKRLLQGQWLCHRAIDGKPDKATGAALADFRKRMHFDRQCRQCRTVQGPGTARRARRSRRPAIPSATTARDALLVALGADGRRQGRCRAAGGRCSRAPAPGPSPRRWTATRSIFWPSARTAARWWAAAQNFCTTAVGFEIAGQQNCAARGFTEAGFAATRRPRA